MRIRKTWTQKDVEEFKLDYPNLDMLPQHFEQKYGRSFDSLKVKAQTLGLKRGRAKTVRSVAFYLPKDDIVNDYLSGNYTCRTLGAKYGCSFPTISIILKEKGIRVKSNTETVKVHYFKEDYFDVIDTHAKAYFLGYICADGYVNNKQQALSFYISMKDVEILENLKKELGSDHLLRPLEHINPKSGHASKMVQLYIQSKHMVDSLNKLGVYQAKSLTMKFLDLPEEFHNSFCLGYFDGDGCVKTRQQISVVGTWEFCQKYQEILISKVGLNLTKLYPHDTTKELCYMQYSGREHLTKIFNFLYKDSPYKLTRKYDRFTKLMNNELVEKY